MGCQDATATRSAVNYKACSAPFLRPGLNQLEKQCWRALVSSWARLLQELTPLPMGI